MNNLEDEKFSNDILLHKTYDSREADGSVQIEKRPMDFFTENIFKSEALLLFKWLRRNLPYGTWLELSKLIIKRNANLKKDVDKNF